MSDVRTLLHQAAAAPARPLSIAEVAARAGRRGLRRRISIGLATLGALGGVATGGQLVLSPARPAPPGLVDRQHARHAATPQPAELEASRDAQRDDRGPVSRPGRPGSPSYAGDGPARVVVNGQRMAFTDGSALYVADLNGANALRISPGSVGYEAFGSSWSPDGTRIAYGDYQACMVDAGFAGSPGSTCPDGDGVAVSNADGSEHRRLASGAQPAWSPDGHRIAFVRDDGIYLMRPDFSDLRRVPNTETGGNPDWSPDGTLIAFSRLGTCAGCSHVYVIRPDGSGLRRITPEEMRGADPAWSHDGARIVFTGGTDPANSINFNVEVFTVRPDGSDLRRLTEDPPGGSTTAPAWIDSSPDWTADGRIVWARDEGSNGAGNGSAPFELYVMNADGSGRVRLFRGMNPAVAPSR